MVEPQIVVLVVAGSSPVGHPSFFKKMHAPTSSYSRSNPFPAKLLVNRRLTAPDSPKDTRHFELDLTGWGLSFEVGDSMAIYASNDPALVDEITTALFATGKEIVLVGKTETTFRDALLRLCSIRTVTPKFLKAIAERASAAPLLKELLLPARKLDLDTYLWGMEVVDFLVEHPSVRFTPQEFVGLLSKLQPRLYSVASSLKQYPDSVHLIIDIIRYESHGRERLGVATGFMAERAANAPVPVYPSSSKIFSSAGKWRHAPDHGRTRNGRRTRSVLFCKSAKSSVRAARHGSSSDRSTNHPIIFIAKISKPSKKKGTSRASIRPSRAIRRKRFTCNTGCRKTRPRFGNGWKRAPSFLSAVMPSEWRKMSMPRCGRSCRRKVEKTSKPPTHTSRS